MRAQHEQPAVEAGEAIAGPIAQVYSSTLSYIIGGACALLASGRLPTVGECAE